MKGKFCLLLFIFCCSAVFAQQKVLSIQHFNEDDGFSESLVTYAAQDSIGYIWLSTWDGLYRYDGYRFINYKARPGDNCPLETNRISYIELAKDQKLICWSNNKFYLFDPKTEQFQVSPIKGNVRLYAVPDDVNSLVRSIHEYANIEFRILLVDKQQGIWLYSHRGLERITYKQAPIRPSHSGQEGEEIVRGLYHDRGHRIWVADKNGYVRVREEGSQQFSWLTRNGSLSPSAIPFGSNVYCFFEDSRGNMWLGTKPDGLFRLTPHGKEWHISHFTHNPQQPFSISNNAIYDIKEDARGRLIVATYDGGINFVETMADGKVRFVNHNNLLRNFPTAALRSRCIEILPTGIMLIGTTNGLLTTQETDDYRKMVFHENVRRPDVTTSLANNYVVDIVRMHDGSIFVATSGGGTEQIVSKDLLCEDIEFRHFSTRTGLSSDMVLTTVEDNQGKLWIVSEASLSCLNPASGISSNYLKSFFNDRFVFSEVKPLCLPDGHLLFGTSQGTLLVTPEQMAKSSYVPPIAFNCDSVIILTPDLRDFHVHFAAIDYNKNENIVYAYMLEGMDNEWHYTRNNEINYVGLAPGIYRLHVRSTNGDGMWTNNEKVITLHRRARFNETPYAWMLYGLLLALLIIGAIYTIRYIRRLQDEIRDVRLTSNEKIALLGERIKELLPGKETGEEIHENEQQLSEEDRIFAQRLKALITKNIGNSELSVKDIAMEMGMSRTVLYARMKRIFNSSPNNLVLNMRIDYAKTLLSKPGAHIANVAYNCGFSDPKYFSRCFKKLTGKRPTEYMS